MRETNPPKDDERRCFRRLASASNAVGGLFVCLGLGTNEGCLRGLGFSLGEGGWTSVDMVVSRGPSVGIFVDIQDHVLLMGFQMARTEKFRNIITLGGRCDRSHLVTFGIAWPILENDIRTHRNVSGNNECTKLYQLL